MHKDANLRKRNALVIPGGLLAIYALLGIAYVAVLRGNDGNCGDASLIILAGACRSALLVLAIPLVLGLALVGVGALAFRSKASCRNGHGSWTHFTLALLISFLLVALLGRLLSPSLVGPDASIVRGTVDYPVTTIFAGLSAVALLILVPFVILYAAQARANPCCRAKGCFEPCFCDEPATDEATEEAAVTEPAPAAGPVVAADPTPAPDSGSASDDQWAVVPEETEAKPTDEWEVVPDEPLAPSPPTPEPRARASRQAPPLAVRPTDPAAAPTDAMAVAAKWAEEDEEAERELLGTSNSRRGRLAKSAKKTAAKPAKPVKKAKK